MGRILANSSSTKLRDFLKDRHKGRPEGVPAPRDVLVLTPSCTVNDALTKLSERAVLGAPYLRDDGKDFLGFVDLHDIVHALVSHMFPPDLSNHGEPRRAGLVPDGRFPACADRILTLVRDKGGDFCDRTLEYQEEGRRRAFIRVDETDHSLLDVIQTHFVNVQYTEPPVRHRVAVYKYAVDASRLTDAETTIEVTDVFSVSDITRFLNRWNEPREVSHTVQHRGYRGREHARGRRAGRCRASPLLRGDGASRRERLGRDRRREAHRIRFRVGPSEDHRRSPRRARHARRRVHR